MESAGAEAKPEWRGAVGGKFTDRITALPLLRRQVDVPFKYGAADGLAQQGFGRQMSANMYFNDLDGLHPSQGKRMFKTVGGEAVAWRPGRRPISQPGSLHVEKPEGLGIVVQNAPKVYTMTEKRHIRQVESKLEIQDKPWGKRTVYRQNGLRAVDQPALEIDVTTEMARKARVGDLLGRRNCIDCRAGGDKCYRFPEYAPSFYKAGGLIAGSTFHRGMYKKTQPRNSSSVVVIVDSTGSRTPTKSYQDKQVEREVEEAQAEVVALTQSWENQTLKDCVASYREPLDSDEEDAAKNEDSPAKEDAAKKAEGGKKGSAGKKARLKDGLRATLGRGAEPGRAEDQLVQTAWRGETRTCSLYSVCSLPWELLCKLVQTGRRALSGFSEAYNSSVLLAPTKGNDGHEPIGGGDFGDRREVRWKRLEADSHTIEHFHMEDIHSFYWWDSKLEEEQEVRATIDSEVPFAVLMEAIAAEHPYDLPMIVSSALPPEGEETPADATSEPKYVMGVALVNGTTADVAQGLAKSIVEVKYAACAQVEKHGNSETDFYITLKTLSAGKEQVVVDFGGLEFEWMPIRANEKYEKWLEDNVVIRQHAAEL
ncbi:HERC1 [Symbiodinium pilosum]|uniref:HERC1 protein n=1 Tax=Symbiodinium pilosum TaxID=2952 RepID=A0A812JUE8_SYMPI|nr:HERC1 [Symbiodinium pilosum]